MKATIYCEYTDPFACVRETYKGQSAAFDIAAVNSVTIEPKSFAEVNLGVKLGTKQKDYYIKFHTRSSFGKKGLRVHPGVIDWGYTGVLSVFVYNFSDEQQFISPGDFVVQATIEKKIPHKFVEVDNIDEYIKGLRGSNGFGSTNKSINE